MSDPQESTSRLDKVEEDVEDLTDRVGIVEGKLADQESQLGRITSHIESEVGLARTDLGRIETKLFGKDEDTDGGKIGHISKKIYRMEIWFLAMICASGIVIFLIAIYYLFVSFKGK